VLKKADKQYELSDFRNAILSYQEVLEKQPNHLEANSRIADCYRHLNQLDKALPYYQAAVNQQGVKDLYVFQYGLTLQELGRYEQAQQVFDRLAANSAEFRTRSKQFSEACAFARNFDEVNIYRVSNEYINTAGSEFAPALLRNGRVVFSSTRTDISTRNNRNTPETNSVNSNHLFITQRDKNGFLETPVTLHSGFGNGTNEGPISYAPDGKWVAITKNSFVGGIRQIPSSGQEMTLYLAQCDANGDWTSTVPFPHNSAGYSSGYPAFSTDGRLLYFASNRPGGFGGYDLYVSYKTANSWSTPENLGPSINTIGNEISPFHDGSSLFFSSDFHRGFGGFDIFKAEESNGKWATLYHGGSGLNSSSDDYGFVFDPAGNIGYFVSNRVGGKGIEDIYKITKETETVVVKVTDASNGKPIPAAIIDFSKCGDKSYEANNNGLFNFQVFDNLDCDLIISKTGYISKVLTISTINLKLSRTIEVSLYSENSSYKGKVVSSLNGAALENVKVISTNRETSEVNETLSDRQGEYFISLVPNTSYLIRFSRASYIDVNLNLTPSSTDMNRIQTTEMSPVGTSVTTSAPKAETATVRQPSPPKAEPSVIRQPPATTRAGNSSTGFSIQLASVSSQRVDLTAFRNAVGNYGNVYVASENGQTKVRAGIFATRLDAEAAIRIVKQKGYPGAFIVSEKNKDVSYVSIPEASSKAEETALSGSAAVTAIDLSGYLIRLATLTDLKFFNESNILDIGIVNKVPKSRYTIILLSGYDTKQAAELALRRVKEKGYPEAYIVVESNGEFKKVQ
jgi:cell division septation protein DedD